MSHDWKTIYCYNNKNLDQKKLKAEKLKADKIKFVTFAKIFEKSKGIGYHFIGIFIFDKFEDKAGKTMIYKKISDKFSINY